MAELAGLRIWLGRWNLSIALETDELERQPMPHLAPLEGIEEDGLDDEVDVLGGRLGFRS